MTPLSYQIGNWLTKEIKLDNKGRRYQFGHKLEWFDTKKKIAKLTITGVYEDSEVKTFWEGFKYWNIQENKIIYTGMSRDGRTANGYVEVIDENTINTIYSGNSPSGKKVYLNDIAKKEDSNHFTSYTKIRYESTEKWKVINTDHWVRVDKQVFNDKLK
ncbi:hypothetical protein GTQ40_12710 [Flavobacteriaceae bacterium R38]|nr:hypothetical protein [Flavobacteriaceae bacterium R38]